MRHIIVVYVFVFLSKLLPNLPSHLAVPTVDQDGIAVLLFSAATADLNSSSLLPRGIGTGARGFASREIDAVNVIEGSADFSLERRGRGLMRDEWSKEDMR